MSVEENVTGLEELRGFVSCIFENWFGLQAAISNGMGGTPQQTSMKLSQMTDTIVEMCIKIGTSKEDLSDALEDFADEFFHTEFEDGSIDEIAAILWSHSQDWLSGNKDSMRGYVAGKRRNNCEAMLERLNDCNEEMDTDGEELDSKSTSVTESTTSTPQPVEDPDGWTIPKHHRKRNR